MNIARTPKVSLENLTTRIYAHVEQALMWPKMAKSLGKQVQLL